MLLNPLLGLLSLWATTESRAGVLILTIKSDRWIREMAETKGMIEPFESGQVRQKGDEKLISYGTSSYGYDVRCSREFKVFTNINSATVDPRISMRAVSSTLRVMSALFHPIPSPLPQRWNIFEFPAMF